MSGLIAGDHAKCASDRNISGPCARRVRAISPAAHEIGTIGYTLVTKRTATNAPTKPARRGSAKATGLKKFIRKRAERPPFNPAVRAANAAIADATKTLLAARTPGERRAALADLRRLVFADEARVNQEDRAAAVLAAEAEVDAMRRLTGDQLGAALLAAAEVIADESDDKRFATFKPTSGDLDVVARKLRNGVKGRWLIAYLANRTGAFNKDECSPEHAEERAAHGKDALKHTPAVQRLSRRAR